MLYIAMTAAVSVWMAALVYKSKLSWHSIVVGYSIGVFSADMLEVSFNLLLGLYKFPVNLLKDPVFDNELGIIFSDTVILPFTLIIFLHYASKVRPWRTSLPFAALFIILEIIFLKFGYMRYIHWNLAFSALFYIVMFRLITYIAPYIIGYNPPIPYTIRLLTFSHTIIMWVGATFALPLLKLYQFRPGIFKDIMADCRFTDLLCGDVLALILAIFVPRISNRMKPLIFAITIFIGISFALYSFFKGWLIYHHWNHLFMSLRYFVPILLIMLYDRWELSYQKIKH